MGKEFPDGDLILSKGINKELLPGHCYVFNYYGQDTVHRLIKTDGYLSYFIGDSSLRIERVKNSEVLYEVITEYSSAYNLLITALNRVYFKTQGFLPLFSYIRKYMIFIFCKLRKGS